MRGRKEGDDRWARFVSGGDGCAGERLSGESGSGWAERGGRAGGRWAVGKMDWASFGEKRSRAEEMSERAGWAAFVFLFFLPLLNRDNRLGAIIFEAAPSSQLFCQNFVFKDLEIILLGKSAAVNNPIIW